jgi:hypothetical protein
MERKSARLNFSGHDSGIFCSHGSRRGGIPPVSSSYSALLRCGGVVGHKGGSVDGSQGMGFQKVTMRLGLESHSHAATGNGSLSPLKKTGNK